MIIFTLLFDLTNTEAGVEPNFTVVVHQGSIIDMKCWFF